MTSAAIRFLGGSSRGSQHYRSPEYPIQLFEVNRIAGFIPGPAKAELLLPGVTKRWDDGKEEPVSPASYIYNLGEVQIPASSGPWTVPFEIAAEAQILGIIYNGTRDKPVADANITLDLTRSERRAPGRDSSYIYRQPLRTDAEGKFVGLGIYGGIIAANSRSAADLVGISIPWKTADGRKTTLSCSLRDKAIKWFDIATGGTYHEIDMSQAGTVRVAFTGAGNLLTSRRTVNDAPLLRCERPHRMSDGCTKRLNWPDKQAFDTLLFADTYNIQVHLF